MKKSSTYLAIGISLAALSASAAGVVPASVPNAAAMLSGARQIAKDAGLPTDDIIIAQAPPTPQSVAANSASKDDLMEALPALIAAAKMDDEAISESLVALGIQVPSNSVSVKSIPMNKDDEGWRIFSILRFSGETKIQIVRYLKSDKRGRTYLLAMDGTLLSAALTRKSSGLFYSDPIQLPDAQTGYRELLGFWVQYYRDNLKGKEQITARN